MEMAENLVDALDRAIKFGEKDAVIAGVLHDKKIRSGPTLSGVGNGAHATTSMSNGAAGMEMKIGEAKELPR